MNGHGNVKLIRLGEILVNMGALSREDLDAALEKQKNTPLRIGEILVQEGYITENVLAEALCRQLDLQPANLAAVKPQQEALAAVPENVAVRLSVLPLNLAGADKIVVAMSDPLDTYAVDEIYLLTNRNVEIRVATSGEINKALVNYYRVQTSVHDAMADVMSRGAGEEVFAVVSPARAQEVTDMGADAAPVVRLVNSILEQAVREKASDIHIEPSEKITRVRFRIDGSLFSSVEIPSNLHPPLVARIKILAGMDIAEKRRPQDGRILIRVSGTRIDLRVSTLPSILGEKVVLRLLAQTGDKIGIKKLGFCVEQENMLKDAISASNGIVLVTGPTGSGKSTTLYSLLEILNQPTKNIITLEDPVEYTIAGLTQTQINEKIGLTFGAVLRSVLRQDPDIVMVGEIRDTETSQLAVRAALTGHLVLSTLHTNDAPTAINRLLDMGVPRYLIASSVRAVLAQRLAKSLCPQCKEEMVVTPAVEKETGIAAGTVVYAPKGCSECRFTGYRGRTVIAEVMPVDKTMRAMISEGASEQDLRDYARTIGMTTMREDVKRKVENGITSIEEMLFTTMTD